MTPAQQIQALQKEVARLQKDVADMWSEADRCKAEARLYSEAKTLPAIIKLYPQVGEAMKKQTDEIGDLKRRVKLMEMEAKAAPVDGKE